MLTLFFLYFNESWKHKKSLIIIHVYVLTLHLRYKFAKHAKIPFIYLDKVARQLQSMAQNRQEGGAHASEGSGGVGKEKERE